MHVLSLRAVRCEMGISERRACRRARVCRETLQAFERGEWIATRTKRERLVVMYARWRDELAWEVMVAHCAEEDDEMSPRDVAGEFRDVYTDGAENPTTRPAESGVHLIETIPPPPRVPREFAA